MDIQTRKLSFIQEFLKLQNEEVISKLEKLLKNEQKNISENEFLPMSIEELNQRIDQSEDDFINNRFKTTEELLAKFK
jgi:hypothetical protein